MHEPLQARYLNIILRRRSTRNITYGTTRYFLFSYFSSFSLFLLSLSRLPSSFLVVGALGQILGGDLFTLPQGYNNEKPPRNDGK